MEEYAGEEGQEGEEDAEDDEDAEAEGGEDGEEASYEEEEGTPYHCAQPLRWLLYTPPDLKPAWLGVHVLKSSLHRMKEAGNLAAA